MPARDRSRCRAGNGPEVGPAAGSGVAGAAGVRARNRTGFGAGAALLAAALIAPGGAAAFTAEQAANGGPQYQSNCGQCHGQQLQGGDGPALRGLDVMGNFATAGGLYDFISVAMPPSEPGQLGEEVYLNIVAYIMARNGAAPDGTALTTDNMAAANLVALTTADAAPAAPAAPVAPAADAAAAAPPAAGPAAQPAAQPAAPGDLPQAFTWGMDLPQYGDTPQEAVPAEPALPQAFTWGMELQQYGADAPAAAAEPAAAAPAPGLPQAFTWGMDLPQHAAATPAAAPALPQAFTWGKELPQHTP